LNFEKCNFVKNKFIFPNENVSGATTEDTKKAGEMQKFRQ